MAAIPDNTRQRAAAPLRARVERFWRWWSNELLAMVPERFASLAGTGRVPLIAFDDAAVVLLEPRPAEGAAEERVSLAQLEPAQGAAAVRGLLERAGETRGRARIALAPREALVRRVSMPAATEENLETVLGFEMDRLTPFRADEVYYDHRVTGRDVAAGTISVLLAVARREIVDARIEQARALGLSVQGVAVREDTARAGAALDVLPSIQRGERDGPRERLAKQVLAAGAIVLLLVLLLLPVYSKNREVHAIKPALDKAHADAQATDALIRELDRHVADYNFLLTRRYATYPALAYVEEVTRLLPDNTWLQQFDIKNAGKTREVLISGETVSSSKLIEILEQSRLLQNAAPRGTVTRGTQPGTERFVIAAEVRPRPPPESSPVTQAQAPVATVPPYAAPQAMPGAEQPQTAVVTPVGPPKDMELLFKPRGKVIPPSEIPKAPGT
jgi:general secretion pathway protein L